MQNQQNKNSHEALLELRQEIDEIDEKIISLLVQRMSVIEKVGALKRNNQEKNIFERTQVNQLFAKFDYKNYEEEDRQSLLL